MLLKKERAINVALMKMLILLICLPLLLSACDVIGDAQNPFMDNNKQQVVGPRRVPPQNYPQR